MARLLLSTDGGLPFAWKSVLDGVHGGDASYLTWQWRPSRIASTLATTLLLVSLALFPISTCNAQQTEEFDGNLEGSGISTEGVTPSHVLNSLEDFGIALRESSRVYSLLGNRGNDSSPKPAPLDWIFHGKKIECAAGKKYNIKDMKELDKYMDELECIYSLGRTPTELPSGVWGGRVYQIFGGTIFNAMAGALWRGKLGTKTVCSDNNRTYGLIYNFLSTDLFFPAFMYLGELNSENVADDEPGRGETHMFIDYTLTFDQVCKADGVKLTIIPGSTLVNDPFPFNLFIDVTRAVGRSQSGGYIMLGKTYFRNGVKYPGEKDIVVAYWAVEIDSDEMFDNNLSWQLGPLVKSFTVKRRSAIEQIPRMLPFDRFIVSPYDTFLKLVDYTSRLPYNLPPFSPSLQDIKMDNDVFITDDAKNAVKELLRQNEDEVEEDEDDDDTDYDL